jgi:hypothetical protein
LYLASFSELAAKTYFKSALQFCRLNRLAPSLLLHPLDFLDGTDAPELKFFPAMNVAAERKMELVSQFLQNLSKYYTLVSMREHANQIIQNQHLTIKAVSNSNQSFNEYIRNPKSEIRNP